MSYTLYDGTTISTYIRYDSSTNSWIWTSDSHSDSHSGQLDTAKQADEKFEVFNTLTHDVIQKVEEAARRSGGALSAPQKVFTERDAESEYAPDYPRYSTFP